MYKCPACHNDQRADCMQGYQGTTDEPCVNRLQGSPHSLSPDVAHLVAVEQDDQEFLNYISVVRDQVRTNCDFDVVTGHASAYAEDAPGATVAPVEPPPMQDVRENPAAHTMPSNPKQFYGDTKVPLHLFPTTAIALGAMGFLEGRHKYGSDNFRAAPVEAMTYIRAAQSHLNLYREGEWVPDDSLVPHLGLALACIAILIDAHYAGSLIDNRNYPGGYAKAIKELQPLVQKIRDMHADKTPKHYTIADAA